MRRAPTVGGRYFRAVNGSGALGALLVDQFAAEDLAG
jgi:hypothetical protein